MPTSSHCVENLWSDLSITHTNVPVHSKDQISTDKGIFGKQFRNTATSCCHCRPSSSTNSSPKSLSRNAVDLHLCTLHTPKEQSRIQPRLRLSIPHNAFTNHKFAKTSGKTSWGTKEKASRIRSAMEAALIGHLYADIPPDETGRKARSGISAESCFSSVPTFQSAEAPVKVSSATYDR